MQALVVFAILAGVTGASPWDVYVELFGNPYRNADQTVAPNPTFASQTSIGSVAISYQGFAQIPSSSPTLPSRLLFAVRPSATSTTSLPAVFLKNDQNLAADVTTVLGVETFVGPAVAKDVWFSFGVEITNGASPTIMLHYYALDTFTSQRATFPLCSNMLTSTSAVAVVPELTYVTTSPTYVTALRAFPAAFTADDFYQTASMLPPATYFWQNGMELGVFGFELPASSTIVSCANTGVIKAVNYALWGRPIGLWPSVTKSYLCNVERIMTLPVVTVRCLNRHSCIIPQTSADYNIDPCPFSKKWMAISFTCSTAALSTPPATSSSSSRSLSSLTASNSSSPTASNSSSPTASNSSSPTASNSSSPTPSNSSSPSPSLSTLAPFLLALSANSSVAPRSNSESATRPVRSPVSAYQITEPATRAPQSSTPVSTADTDTSNFNAFQLSLPISLRTTKLSDSARDQMMTAFVTDASTALFAPVSRFILVEFRNATTFSTLLSFVVLPNITDVDASILASDFVSQMQVKGSILRASSLLVWATDPPVPIDVIGVRVRICDDGVYVIVPASCPSIVLSSSSSMSLNVFVVTGVVAGIAAVLALVVCWRMRRPQNSVPDLMWTGSPYPSNAVAVGMNRVTSVSPAFFLSNPGASTMAMTSVTPMSMRSAPYAVDGTRTSLMSQGQFGHGGSVETNFTLDSDF